MRIYLMLHNMHLTQPLNRNKLVPRRIGDENEPWKKVKKIIKRGWSKAAAKILKYNIEMHVFEVQVSRRGNFSTKGFRWMDRRSYVFIAPIRWLFWKLSKKRCSWSRVQLKYIKISERIQYKIGRSTRNL